MAFIFLRSDVIISMFLCRSYSVHSSLSLRSFDLSPASACIALIALTVPTAFEQSGFGVKDHLTDTFILLPFQCISPTIYNY